MRPHPSEQLRLVDDLADPAPDPRGVVEHDDRGHPAEVAEDVLQALADAFRSLAGEDLRVAVVAVREGECQVLLATTSPRSRKSASPKSHCDSPGCPTSSWLARGPAGPESVFHIALDRVVRAIVARRFGLEPIMCRGAL